MTMGIITIIVKTRESLRNISTSLERLGRGGGLTQGSSSGIGG